MTTHQPIKKWYAVYTKPRWEKKVYKMLIDKGVVAYCPVNKVRKKWSDRYKIIEEPLFKSYVFVRIHEDEFLKVRMVDGVLNFLYWCGQPAVVKDEEIDEIQTFLGEYQMVELLPLDVIPGQQVKVIKGVFTGLEGEVEKIDKRYITLVINSIGYAIRAKLPSRNIEITQSKSVNT